MRQFYGKKKKELREMSLEELQQEKDKWIEENKKAGSQEAKLITERVLRRIKSVIEEKTTVELTHNQMVKLYDEEKLEKTFDGKRLYIEEFKGFVTIKDMTGNIWEGLKLDEESLEFLNAEMLYDEEDYETEKSYSLQDIVNHVNSKINL